MRGNFTQASFLYASVPRTTTTPEQRRGLIVVSPSIHFMLVTDNREIGLVIRALFMIASSKRGCHSLREKSTWCVLVRCSVVSLQANTVQFASSLSIFTTPDSVSLHPFCMMVQGMYFGPEMPWRHESVSKKKSVGHAKVSWSVSHYPIRTLL